MLRISKQRFRSPHLVRTDDQGFSDMWERLLRGLREAKIYEHKKKVSERCEKDIATEFFNRKKIGYQENNIQGAKI